MIIEKNWGLYECALLRAYQAFKVSVAIRSKYGCMDGDDIEAHFDVTSTLILRF